MTYRLTLLATFATLAIAAPSSAQVIISEVAPWASGDAPYGADWFELTNTSAAAVDITGWKVDDSSNAFASALTLRGVTTINPGQSAVFFEGEADGSTDAVIQTAFINAWFGGSAPAGFAIGAYGGSGIGLSSGGDAVNIFNGAGVAQAGVTFGASTSGFTFDNAAGLSGPITALSIAGVNGAFSATGAVGSPGRIAIPEPTSILMLCIGAGLLARPAARNRRRAA